MALAGGALTLSLLAPAGAQAGTYDVVSCNAPGANGRNNSLEYAAASYDPQHNAVVGGWYEADGTCADGLIARSRTVDGTVAKWLTWADWSFVAPEGTDIVAMTSWRFAEARDSGGDDPNTLTDESDRWRAEVLDGTTGAALDGPAGGDTCGHPGGVDSCNLGVPGGSAQTHPRIITRSLHWRVSCVGPIGDCPTSFYAYPLATMVVYGTRVTLQDTSAPQASLGGPLFSPGWHKPTETVTYSASDNSGIRSATIAAGATTGSDNRPCDFTYKVPCSNATNRALQFDGLLADGQYPIQLTVTDAAQNPRTVTARVAVDGTPPTVSLRPPRRRKLRLLVRDAASGVAAAQLSVRNSLSEPYRPLPTQLRRGIATARLDRGNPRTVDVAATVSDNAGNQLTGQPARVRVTSVTSQRLRATVRSRGRVRVKHGRPLTIRGQVALANGAPVPGVPVSVTSTPRNSGAVPYIEAQGLTTAANGRFVITLPAGPARAARIVSSGGAGAMPAERTLRLQVPASSTITASRTRVSGAHRVRFSGKVRGDVGANLVVVLQGKENGKWRTFADSRTRAGGKWRASYRFSGRPGSYPVRVRVREQANLPYVTGYSKRVTIHVR